MQIQDERSGESLVVRVAGRLDAVTALEFENHCRQAVEQGERSLILDFGGLEYLSSAGIRAVLIAAKSVAKAGGQFALANVRGVVREVLEVSGLLGIFRCLDSLEPPATPS